MDNLYLKAINISVVEIWAAESLTIQPFKRSTIQMASQANDQTADRSAEWPNVYIADGFTICPVLSKFKIAIDQLFERLSSLPFQLTATRLRMLIS